MPFVQVETTLERLSDVSSYIVKILKDKPVVVFYGEMGAGKTTLIKNICKLLQVKDEVNSPTFSIVNEYSTDKDETIYHFDFYRIDKEEEAFDMGYEEYLYSGNMCFIEWPDKIQSLIPKEVVEVSIQFSENKRSYKIGY